MRPSLIVALTGGIGSGKSTVARVFTELGVSVHDTDLIARDVVATGTPARDDIVTQFGRDILDASGELDRSKLREMVFSDPIKRQRLERIVHPRIRTELEARLECTPGVYCVVSIALLFETSQADKYQRILVVDVPTDIQVERAIDRDHSPRATIEGILAAQIDREKRVAMADDVIDNSADLDTLRSQVVALHKQYLELAESNQV